MEETNSNIRGEKEEGETPQLGYMSSRKSSVSWDKRYFLPIVPGWNYIVRMYQPRKEILEGTWKFPVPVTP